MELSFVSLWASKPVRNGEIWNLHLCIRASTLNSIRCDSFFLTNDVHGRLKRAHVKCGSAHARATIIERLDPMMTTPYPYRVLLKDAIF